MADEVELKIFASDTTEGTMDDERNVTSEKKSLPDIKDNLSHSERSDMDNVLEEAIKTGNVQAVKDWLATLRPGDERETELNKVKYNDGMGGYCTALNFAAYKHQTQIVKLLLEEGADPNKKDSRHWNALHAVCSDSLGVDITEMVKLLVERNCNVNEIDKLGGASPLFYAALCKQTTAVSILLDGGADPNNTVVNGENVLHAVFRVSFGTDVTEMVKLLVERSCNVNQRDLYKGLTPLHGAVQSNHPAALRILLENGANMDDSHSKLMFNAAGNGSLDIVEMLMEYGAKVDSEVMRAAMTFENIVKKIIKVPQWPQLMRQTLCYSELTTPFREMIKYMPDAAEEILNRCTVTNPDTQNPDCKAYRVAFNFEFVEDTRDKKARTNESGTPNIERVANELKRGCDYHDVVDRAEHNYTTSWGPVGFKKENHPLALMVKYKRLNLLTHPLVGSLLHHKWKKFGQCGYFINLLTYLVFLAFLTTFAFIIENPRSQACITSNMSYNGPEIDCGTSTVQRTFVYISAAVVLILSFCRLLLEGVQFILQFPRYFKDWVNWMEVVLYLSSIIFVCVFGSDCLCPLTWQWQIGVMAVFLGWIDLIVFISKFPLTGIYVLMFIKISQTFLKTLILSALLVFSFGLTFYLTFTQPEILRSPFSTPGRSLLKIMTMTTGEFDFDSIFRQDPTGASDNADEIPFPPISFMLWIVFVIIMPILLTNMLVGLAVGDIGAIQEEAELQKLALQVEQVLAVEEILPRKWRRRFTSGYKVVYPNFKVSWQNRILFLLWGGKRYDTRKSLQKVVHASKDENKKKADKLLCQVDSLKTSVNKQVMDLKTSIRDETEKVEKLLHEMEDLKGAVNGQVEDLKTSIEDIKNLLKQFIETAEA